MVLSVEYGQGPDWTALTPLIQAKQREMAERVQADAQQARQPGPETVVTAARDTGGARLDMRNGREERAPEGRGSRESTAQIALQAHIAFKAQGGDEAGLTLPKGAGTQGPEAASKAKPPNALSEDAQRVVKELQARDAEVRRHEQAHAAVGGSYASAPSYVYQVGPDGRRYAVGGSVQIDMSPVPNDPEATIAKMEVVRRAAMAPAEPSSADRSVAAAAQAAQAQALADLNADRTKAFGSTLDLRA